MSVCLRPYLSASVNVRLPLSVPIRLPVAMSMSVSLCPCVSYCECLSSSAGPVPSAWENKARVIDDSFVWGPAPPSVGLPPLPPPSLGCARRVSVGVVEGGRITSMIMKIPKVIFSER